MSQKISAMTPAAALTGSEEVPAVQGAANVKTTTADIAALAAGGTPTSIANGGGSVVVESDGDVIVAVPAGKRCEIQCPGGTIVTVSDTGLINIQAGAGGAFQAGCNAGQLIVNAAGAVNVQDGSGASATVTYQVVNGAPWAAPFPITFHDAIERIAAALFAANGGVQF